VLWSSNKGRSRERNRWRERPAAGHHAIDCDCMVEGEWRGGKRKRVGFTRMGRRRGHGSQGGSGARGGREARRR
jgi:hypothetical protein